MLVNPVRTDRIASFPSFVRLVRSAQQCKMLHVLITLHVTVCDPVYVLDIWYIRSPFPLILIRLPFATRQCHTLMFWWCMCTIFTHMHPSHVVCTCAYGFAVACPRAYAPQPFAEDVTSGWELKFVRTDPTETMLGVIVSWGKRRSGQRAFSSVPEFWWCGFRVRLLEQRFLLRHPVVLVHRYIDFTTEPYGKPYGSMLHDARDSQGKWVGWALIEIKAWQDDS